MGRDYYIFSSGRLKRKENTIYFIDSQENKKSIPIEQIERIHLFGEIDLNTKLSSLPNIGKVLEEQLLKINIKTYGDLKSIGAKQAWLNIQALDESACMNRLLALEGAIQGMKKQMLPADIKEDLRKFYNFYKK